MTFRKRELDRERSLPFFKGNALINFNQDLPAGFLVTGFSTPESWGRWSLARIPQIALPFLLQGRIKLIVTGRAFGPNANSPITIMIEKQFQNIQFGPDLSGQEVVFKDLKSGSEIKIQVPNPTSPSDISKSSDTRLLGVGLAQIKIVSLDE